MSKKKYKILWIDVVSELGGAQLSMYEACKKLAEDGVVIEAALPTGPLYDKFHEAGIKVYPVSPIRASKRGLSLFTTAAKLLSSPHTINQIVKGCTPDIVHANSLAAFMTTAHVPYSIPTIWHVRDIQKDPHIIRNSVRRATGIITASETVDETLSDIISRRHKSKLHLVRNGIDTSIFVSKADKAEIRSGLGLPVTGPLIGMVANMVPWKKHDVFIQSAALIKAALPDAQFAVFGRDLFNENKRYIKDLKTLVEKKELAGCFHWVENNPSPATFIPALDMLIHPPKYEPFGRIICEAMVCEVPVVAADIGGPATIITDTHNGWLVRDGKAENFAETAINVLKNPELCKSVTANARRHILTNYSTDRVCHDLMKTYDDVFRRAEEERNYKPDKD